MSKGKDKAIFRSAKLQRGRGKSSLGTSWRHQEMHKDVADILHPELTKHNKTKHWVETQPELTKLIKEKIKLHNDTVDKQRAKLIAQGQTKNLPRRLRNDAAIACECVFTFSPEMAGKFDIKEWVYANWKFIQREFLSNGAAPIRMDLHMDETTPHLHFIFCPTTNEGKISAKAYFGGAKNLSLMQDRYAQAMEKFGLTRGYSRYNVYQEVKAKAVAEGFDASYKGIKLYCEKHKIPVPDRRRHMQKHEWLGQLQSEIDKLTKEKADLEKAIETARTTDDKTRIDTLHKQLKEAQNRIEYLEEFTQGTVIKPFWDEYLAEHPQVEKETDDFDFDDLI